MLAAYADLARFLFSADRIALFDPGKILTIGDMQAVTGAAPAMSSARSYFAIHDDICKVFYTTNVNVMLYTATSSL